MYAFLYASYVSPRRVDVNPKAVYVKPKTVYVGLCKSQNGLCKSKLSLSKSRTFHVEMTKLISVSRKFCILYVRVERVELCRDKFDFYLARVELCRDALHMCRIPLHRQA